MPKRHLLQTLALALVLLACGGLSAPAVEGGGLEYKVKAAFLLNFAKFITWKTSLSGGNGGFTLCVVGDDPFGEALGGMEEKQISGQPVSVLRRDRVSADLDRCRLMFISGSEREQLERILEFADTNRMVTVSDMAGFAAAGGIFEFKNVDGRLSFIVNNSKAKLNGVQISSSLLTLAIEVL